MYYIVDNCLFEYDDMDSLDMMELAENSEELRTVTERNVKDCFEATSDYGDPIHVLMKYISKEEPLANK